MTVTAGPGPLALAGSIFRNGLTHHADGPRHRDQQQPHRWGGRDERPKQYRSVANAVPTNTTGDRAATVNPPERPPEATTKVTQSDHQRIAHRVDRRSRQPSRDTGSNKKVRKATVNASRTGSTTGSATQSHSTADGQTAAKDKDDHSDKGNDSKPAGD